MSTSKNTIDAYNRDAEQYHAHVSDHSDSIFHSMYEKPALRSQLGEIAGKSVISIGCGSGVDAQWLLDNGASHVTGVDISQGLIDIGTREFPELDLRVMDMEHLDFPDNHFDLACSSLAIHYLPSMTRSLREAHRILKPGATYVVSFMHPVDSAKEYTKDSALLGHQRKNKVELPVVYGDYLATESDGTKAMDGYLGDMGIRVYHRTFPVILSQIQESGFALKKLVEPIPLDQMKTSHPETYEQLMRIPSFLICVLSKT